MIVDVMMAIMIRIIIVLNVMIYALLARTLNLAQHVNKTNNLLPVNVKLDISFRINNAKFVN